MEPKKCFLCYGDITDSPQVLLDWIRWDWEEAGLDAIILALRLFLCLSAIDSDWRLIWCKLPTALLFDLCPDYPMGIMLFAKLFNGQCKCVCLRWDPLTHRRRGTMPFHWTAGGAPGGTVSHFHSICLKVEAPISRVWFPCFYTESYVIRHSDLILR